jgi:hypothetical protein
MREQGSRVLKSAPVVLGLLAMQLLLAGCEIRPKPSVHLVEYQSGTACPTTDSDGCSWKKLEQEAEFSALVNCLLAGANILEVKEDTERAKRATPLVVTPLPPRHGYERRHDSTDGNFCRSDHTACSVASRHERAITWATCGTRMLANEDLRGGEDHAHADELDHTAVVTGTLANAIDDYSLPDGLDGPDHWYRFTIGERTRIEVAVAANRAMWSGVVGLVQSAWQPALYLLSSDSAQVQTGHVHRAGVTALFPAELEPGTYYLVVDSSNVEWQRGDGLYRLYLGFHHTLMGPLIERGLPVSD